MPVWKEIFETIRSEVVNGAYDAGDKLATEKAFAERFGVNRHTVRRALTELVQAGVILVRRGSGYYVTEGVLDYRIGDRTRFSQNIVDLGRAPSANLLSARLVPAEVRIATHLKLDERMSVLRAELIGFADGTPICVSEQHFPADRFPGLSEALEETGSVTASLRRYGVVDYRRAWTRVTAAAPSRLIARRLRQSPTAPVLRAEALNLDMAGQPIEFAVSYFAGQRTALMFDRAE